jgi:HlyD family secretion protein
VVAAVRARGPVVSTAVANRTDLEQRVIASGRVRVVTPVQISAQMSGRVVTVGVVDGQRVRAGELLVQMDDAEASGRVAGAGGGESGLRSCRAAPEGRSHRPARVARRCGSTRDQSLRRLR